MAHYGFSTEYREYHDNDFSGYLTITHYGYEFWNWCLPSDAACALLILLPISDSLSFPPLLLQTHRTLISAQWHMHTYYCIVRITAFYCDQYEISEIKYWTPLIKKKKNACCVSSPEAYQKKSRMLRFKRSQYLISKAEWTEIIVWLCVLSACLLLAFNNKGVNNCGSTTAG